MAKTTKKKAPAKKPPKRVGRPQVYTKKLGIKICKRISEGESVRSICKDKKMPAASTIFLWLLDETKQIFSEQYAQARNVQAENLFEELLEIADTENMDDVMRARLRVDTRKWYLSKVLPKKFGDKIDVTSGGEKVIGIDYIKPNGKDSTNRTDS